MLWLELKEKVINPHSKTEVEQVQQFLAKFNLSYSPPVDYTLILQKQDNIVASGSIWGEVFKHIAVDESVQGEGIAARMVSRLIREASRHGHYHYFIFTKPTQASYFASLAFTEVARVEPFVVLLESGLGSIATYCNNLRNWSDQLPDGSRAVVVANCNPFTLGHQHIIAAAAAENTTVIVLLVSEEQPPFSFAERLTMVKQGVKEYNNVWVLSAGKYVVSSATFPDYFTRKDNVVTAQARLDAIIFAQFIAPALGATKRYVGKEPDCPITATYNEALLAVLPSAAIPVSVIPRFTVNNEIVSASKVRCLLKENTTQSWQAIKQFVPPSTYDFLLHRYTPK